MDKNILQALKTDQLVDFTTTGRKTGKPHRIEITFHFFEGKIYLCGMPGRKKDWFANLIANPRFIFHLKQSFSLDIPAVARVVQEAEQRRNVLAFIIAKQDTPQNLEVWVQGATLVQVELEATEHW